MIRTKSGDRRMTSGAWSMERAARRVLSRVGPLALGAVLLACATPNGVERPAVAPPERALPLWELSDGVETLHLLGSIHLLRPDVYPLDPVIDSVFDAAELVAFELDFEEAGRSQHEMMVRAALTDGRTLSEILPSDLAEELERRSTRVGMPFGSLRYLKPWFISLVFSSLVLQTQGFDVASGIDLHFDGRAREAGKEIRGLETVEEQIDALDGLSEAAQIELLRSTLAELDAAAEELDRTTELWRRGDVEGLARVMRQSLESQPELRERLLDDRNQRWVPRIEQMLRQGERAIVIVGVGHLVGERSVIELLRERGYSVVQASSRAPAGVAGR